MKILEAHDRYQARIDRGEPVPDCPKAQAIPGAPLPTAAILAAMADMSGRLAYIDDDEQLDACVEETARHLGLGVTTLDALEDVTMRVIDEYCGRAETLHERN